MAIFELAIVSMGYALLCGYGGLLNALPLTIKATLANMLCKAAS